MNKRTVVTLLVLSGLLFDSEKNAFSAEADSANEPEFRLRNDVSSLSKERTEVKGATLSFSQNKLKDNGSTWNTNGALGYQIVLSDQVNGQDTGNSSGMSGTTVLIPAVSWHVSKDAASSNGEVEELKFNLPVNFKVSPGFSYSALWLLEMRPYYLTDFSFEDEIYGVEASAEFVGRPFGSKIYFGKYTSVRAASPEEKVLQYQVRLVPKIDYSITGKGGTHTTRVSDDDWFCAGGLASFGLKFSKDVPVELGVSYEYMEVLSGNASNVHVLTPSGTFWLDNNKNVALKFTYSKGKTIQAAQKIDVLTLGLELRH